ncbi:hypothetical protein HO133_000219 [Letharia lupina]|uniref:FAD-binding PCMH-type domain-containing protein n=1 Tax=Letharia lupina TaxID=560253 RepID=A0A8H6CH41_9LECA|nr:uncharacterized protein HO133_000219 [Letharia lupina]KAF6223377.1 hypothetical protein HO133_000219 [Letharia lupina]
MSKKLSVYSTQASHSGQMIQTDAANNFWEQIEYAYHQNISFLGTGGGHGYSATLDTVENGIEIDLGHFNTVSIDKDANTMTVGGSVHFANITGLLYDAGKEFRLFTEVGSCSCVGLVGASLGGGVGPYGGLHGLQLDALQSVRMVTGTGSLVNVSATSHPDLWWGMRGAGFNFGIVTSATYQVYTFTNNGQAMSADFRFHASQNASLYEFARSYTGKLPDAFSIDIAIAYNEAFGGTYLFANFIYAGPLEEGMALIQPIIELGPFDQNITMIPWKDIETSSKFGIDALACIKGNFHSVWGLNLYQIDVPTLIDAVSYMDTVYAQYPDFREAFLAIDMYASRVIESVPDDATAYPYRNAVARLWVTFFLTPPIPTKELTTVSPNLSLLDVGFPNSSFATAASQVGRDARSLFVPTSGASTSNIEVYVHYGHGDEGQLGWYTERKLPRLNALKNEYDPNKLFSHYNALEATYDVPK